MSVFEKYLKKNLDFTRVHKLLGGILQRHHQQYITLTVRILSSKDQQLRKCNLHNNQQYFAQI